MRPRNEAARNQLRSVMSRRAAVGAADMAAQLGVSVPTLHRMLPELGPDLIASGRARRTRYALRRSVRGEPGSFPLYEIDPDGRPGSLARLHLLRPEGSLLMLAGTGWPVPEEAREGWWGGLPYPLCDMRPQGYMGRQFARARHRLLGVSPNPEEWDDDALVHVLSQTGSDLSGSLVLGDPAFERWQALKVAPPAPLKARSVGAAYARLAAQAVDAGVAGSSAAGEFPKFTALRDLVGSATPHVLVKFSGADRSSTVRRWSDLLVAEHLALACVGELAGVQGARSRIVQHAGRTFLEVERFDRHGAFGRSRLVGLATLDAALVGAGSSDWTVLASALAALGLLASEAVEGVRRLWWFGRLIANTDMHTGNLSFLAQDGLRLAPAYDMLPMHYAPLAGGELPRRVFEPALPLPADRDVWLQACGVAIGFWKRAAADARIGASFRAICGTNARRLTDLAALV